MGFDAFSRHKLITGAGLLAVVAFSSGASWQAGGAHLTLNHLLSACGLILSFALIRAGLGALPAVPPLPPMERPVGVPQDHAQLTARVLALEAQLEFAPVALFRINHINDLHDISGFEPVNTNARRLLAPGRATDVAALRQTIANLATNQRSVIDFDTEQGTERALAIAGALTVEGQPQRLVALMPVESELEAEAMLAWQRLVHVLTHEIMNSLTPVASLSHTSRELLGGVRASLPADIAGDLDIALDAIGRRADSLTHFVSGYRALASVPDARPQRILVSELFARLSALVAPAWQARGGRALLLVEPEALELMADPGQLEQALVNLIQNAAEACAGRMAPEVNISARLVRGGRLRIEVYDNGPGVPDQLVADIFTPFFSTKCRGSGIGLAMVRQLLHRNGGTVRYAKSISSGARFVIVF